MDEITWTPSKMLKPGDTVTMTLPKMIKRPWWAFWRPRWTEGPLETKRYKVIPGHSASSAAHLEEGGRWGFIDGERPISPEWFGARPD